MWENILIKVVSRPNAVRSVHTTKVKIHPDQLTNKIFIIWRKQEQFNSFNVTGLY